MADHKIIVTVGGYNGVSYEMACSDPDNCETVFQEKTWSDESTCRCTHPDCSCRQDDHAGCGDFGDYIQGLGPECQQVPVNGCGLSVWLDELGEEGMTEWEGVTVEVPVTAFWAGEDGPEFRVAAEYVTARIDGEAG